MALPAQLEGGPLTAGLWRSIEPVYAAILEHPFVAGLTDGTLPADRFAHYLIQDAHYLRDYARALSLLSARAPDEEGVRLFAEHAQAAIVDEKALHRELLPALGIAPETVDATEPAPACIAYTSFLLSVCHGGSFAEALGAVLPCYWIYQEVGRALVAKGSPDERYQRWIDTYAGDGFAAVVASALAVADGLDPQPAGAELERMRDRFVTSARLEWMFWDMGWRMERWPV